jgi:hypothetical protein
MGFTRYEPALKSIAHIPELIQFSTFYLEREANGQPGLLVIKCPVRVRLIPGRFPRSIDQARDKNGTLSRPPQTERIRKNQTITADGDPGPALTPGCGGGVF